MPNKIDTGTNIDNKIGSKKAKSVSNKDINYQRTDNQLISAKHSLSRSETKAKISKTKNTAKKTPKSSIKPITTQTIKKSMNVLDEEKKNDSNDVENLDMVDDEKEKTSKKKKLAKSETTLINVDKIIPRKMSKSKGSYILVIVESPGKIKKLESILGPGYVVVSSFGHIMDLHPKKMSVDFDNKFNPEYHIISGEKKFQDKTKVVKELIAKAAKASKVIIAADHDREGEMIGWSYKVALGLGDDDYERITFNSITKEEVKKAINNPGKLDMLMVDSQKTRRILDRIVGFKISPGLNQIMGMRNLSAGRVQSIVVKLICEKEHEITKFFEGDNASYFKVVSSLSAHNTQTKKITDMKCDLYTDLVIKDDDDDEKDENDQDDQDDQDAQDNYGEADDGTTKMTKAKMMSFKTAEKLMNNLAESII